MKKDNLHITFCMALTMMAAQPLHGLAMDASKAAAILGGGSEVAKGNTTRGGASSALSVGETFNAEIDGHNYKFTITTATSDNHTVTINGFKNTEDKSTVESLDIPKTIEYNGTPYTITAISQSAFASCNALTTVTIPNSVETIGMQVFAGCESLASVTFDENSQLTEISAYLFYNCTSLTSITLPKSVESIAKGSFYNCTSLQSITLQSDNVALSSDQDDGFAFNLSLANGTKIYVPAGSLGSYKSKYAYLAERFEVSQDASSTFTTSLGDCEYTFEVDPDDSDNVILKSTAENSVTSIDLPSSVQYGDNVYQISKISELAFSSCSALESIVIPTSVEVIAADAFKNCNALQTIKLMGNDVLLDSDMDGNLPSDTKINVPADFLKKYKSNYTGNFADRFVADGAATPSNFTAAIAGHDCSFEITEGNNVTIKGLANADDKTSVTSLDIPATIEYNGTTYTITAIGEDAFASCTALNTVTIPNTVEEIGEHAFYNSSLKSIHIPATVKSIGQYTFLYCRSLSSVTFDENCQVTEIKTQTFSTTSLTTITLPKSVTSIEYTAFEDNSNLQSITLLGDNVKLDDNNDLGQALNANLANGTNIYVPAESLETYKSKYYYLTSRFKASQGAMTNFTATIAEYEYSFEITEDNKVTIKGLANADDKTSVTSLEIPKTVTYEDTEYTITAIGKSAFQDCSALTSITIPNTVETIGEWALNCHALKSLTFEEGSNLKTISGMAIYGTALTTITIPASVTYIDAWGIGANQSLKEVIVEGTTPAEVDKKAFKYNADDMVIYVPNGTVDKYKEEWDDYADKIQGLKAATFDDNNLTFEVNEENTITLKKYNGTDADVEIPETVTYDGTTYTVTAIAESAFSTNQKIKTVTIPASVETIGADAFNTCENLSSVSFAEGSKLKTIGHGAFVSTCFEEIELPASLTTIEYDAFADNESLKSIVIPANVKSIGQDAFYNCPKLEYVVLEGANTLLDNDGQIAPNNSNLLIGVPADNLEAYKAANSNFDGKIYANAVATGFTDNSDDITATMADKLWQPRLLSYCRTLNSETVGDYITVCLPFDVDLYDLNQQGCLNAADEIYLLATDGTNLQPVTYKDGGIYQLYLKQADYKPGISSSETTCKVAANTPMLIKLGNQASELKSLLFYNSSAFAKSSEELNELLEPASLTVKAEDASAPDVNITCGGTFQKYTYNDCKDFYTFNTKGTFGPQKKDLDLNPFRVYLRVKDASGQPLQNVNLSAVFGGGSGTTGINGVVSASGEAKSSAIYTLDGRKVATSSYGKVKLPKGIYIVNGKKVVVK